MSGFAGQYRFFQYKHFDSFSEYFHFSNGKACSCSHEDSKSNYSFFVGEMTHRARSKDSEMAQFMNARSVFLKVSSVAKGPTYKFQLQG